MVNTAEYLTIDEVARMLQLKKEYVYRMTSQKEIPVIRIGRLLRFRKRDIEKWLERKTEKPRREESSGLPRDWRRRAAGGGRR